MNQKHKIAGELLKMAKEVLSADFDPETHPFNLMRKRQNEEKMKEIAKHYKKDPKDLTNDEIVKFNQRKK